MPRSLSTCASTTPTREGQGLSRLRGGPPRSTRILPACPLPGRHLVALDGDAGVGRLHHGAALQPGRRLGVDGAGHGCSHTRAQPQGYTGRARPKLGIPLPHAPAPRAAARTHRRAPPRRRGSPGRCRRWARLQPRHNGAMAPHTSSSQQPPPPRCSPAPCSLPQGTLRLTCAAGKLCQVLALRHVRPQRLDIQPVLRAPHHTPRRGPGRRVLHLCLVRHRHGTCLVAWAPLSLRALRPTPLLHTPG